MSIIIHFATYFNGLLLLSHPGNVLTNFGIGQQVCLGGVAFRQLPFVRDDVMNAIVALLAYHQTSFSHFLLAVTTNESLLGVDCSGD